MLREDSTFIDDVPFSSLFSGQQGAPADRFQVYRVNASHTRTCPQSIPCSCPVTSLDFHPDADLLLMSSSDGALSVFNYAVLGDLAPGPDAAPSAVAFAGEETKPMSAARVSGLPRLVVRIENSHGDGRSCNASQFSDCGRYVLSVGSDASLNIFDVERVTKVVSSIGSGPGPHWRKCHGGCTTVAGDGSDGSPQSMDQLLQCDGPVVATGDSVGVVRVWDVRMLGVGDGAGSSAAAVMRLRPLDGIPVLNANAKKKKKTTINRKKKRKKQQDVHKQHQRQSGPSGPDDDEESDDDDDVTDATIPIPIPTPTPTTVELRNYSTHHDVISKFDYNDSRRLLYTVSFDGRLSATDLRRLKKSQSSGGKKKQPQHGGAGVHVSGFASQSASYVDMLECNGGSHIVCATDDGALDLFFYGRWNRPATRTRRHMDKRKKLSFECLCFLKDDLMAGAHTNGYIGLYDVSRSDTVKHVGGLGRYNYTPLRKIALASDGRFIATADDEFKVRFWHSSFIFDGKNWWEDVEEFVDERKDMKRKREQSAYDLQIVPQSKKKTKLNSKAKRFFADMS